MEAQLPLQLRCPRDYVLTSRMRSEGAVPSLAHALNRKGVRPVLFSAPPGSGGLEQPLCPDLEGVCEESRAALPIHTISLCTVKSDTLLSGSEHCIPGSLHDSSLESTRMNTSPAQGAG